MKKLLGIMLGLVILYGCHMMVPVFADDVNGFLYDFDDYQGGAVSFENPEAAEPYRGSVSLGGRTELLKSANTEKGRSLHMMSSDSEYSYLFGKIMNEKNTYNTVVQFDVKTLGVGSQSMKVSLWDSADEASSAQYSWHIFPDGTLKIYSRGQVGEYSCYAQTASIPLMQGQGTQYTGTTQITAPVGEWVNLAAAFDFTERKIDYYVNNRLVFSDAAFYTDALKSGFSHIRFQMNSDDSYGGLSGSEKENYGMYIDNLRVYNSCEPDTVSENAYCGTICDFEDYEEKSLSFNSYDAMYPFKDSIVMGGRCENSRSVVTEKGKSLWLLVDDSDNNDQYMDGAFTEKAVTDKVVMQFDVKPLGLGSATQFGMTGKKTDGTTTVFQRLFSVNPDGTLKIYARGTISDSSGSVSEQCYTAGAFVTLRRGDKITYTDTEPITIPVDKWSRLAAVYDVSGKKIHYYVNGELIFSNAIPFNSGNDLNTTGITNVRIQTSKYSGYGTLTDEEKKKTGLYIDNLKVFLGSSPSELSEGYYEAVLYNSDGDRKSDTDILSDGEYRLQIIARGDDTSRLKRTGRCFIAQYEGDTLKSVVSSEMCITKSGETSGSSVFDYTAGNSLRIFFWDENMSPIMESIEYGKKELYIEILSAVSDFTGNIFTDEECSINLKIRNTLNHSGTADIKFELYNHKNELITEESVSAELERFEITELMYRFSLPAYGTYTLKVSAARTGQVMQIETYNVSRVLKGGSSDSDFGVNTHFDQNKGDTEKNVCLIESAGIGWIRDGISWAAAEREKGIITFTDKWDNYVNAARDKGLNVLMVLGSTNTLYSDGKFPTGEEAVAAFANYAGKVAEHFAGRVICYEIFNEAYANRYYSKENTGKQYAELVNAAAKAIRASDPSAKIAANMECFTDDYHHYNYTKTALNAGICDNIDIISLHPYVQPAAPDDSENGIITRCKTFFEDIAPYGKDIWVSEIGWSSCSDYVTEHESAVNIVKTKIMNMSHKYFNKIFVYDFQNDGNDSENSEHNYGLINTWSGNTSPNSAKEGYAALSAASCLLENCIPDGESTEDGCKQYYFRKNGTQKVITAWREYGSGIITLSGLPKEVTYYDMFGNASTWSDSTGTYSFPINTDVIYIVYD